MSELAQKRIAENIKTKNPILDLGNCGLTELPEGLAELEWVEELILGDKWSEYNIGIDPQPPRGVDIRGQ